MDDMRLSLSGSAVGFLTKEGPAPPHPTHPSPPAIWALEPPIGHVRFLNFVVTVGCVGKKWSQLWMLLCVVSFFWGGREIRSKAAFSLTD